MMQPRGAMDANYEPRTPAAASSGRHSLLKLGYGVAFTVLLPALLWRWAVATEALVPLPPLESLPLGAALVGAGTALLVAGAWALIVLGGGLPMNAFPPPRFVTGGAYALVPHPMYVGFCTMVLGMSVASGSASGLWLVTPAVSAGCVALVLGYERHDLLRRFGVAQPKTWLRLPADEPAPATFADRASVVVLGLLPWLGLLFLLARLGPPPDARSVLLPGEAGWPAVPGAGLLRASTAVAVLLAVVFLPTRAVLRRFAVRALLALALLFPLYLALPLGGAARGPVSSVLLPELLGRWLALDGAAGAVPSFHAVWTVLTAAALVAASPRDRAAIFFWAALAVASSVAAGREPLLGVAAGLLAAAAVLRAGALWAWLRRGAERIANSWHEWHVGPVRFINHALYAAAGAAVGVGLASGVLGPRGGWALALTAVSTLVFAGLWAQVIEGSPQLLRPYGYYGGVLGVAVGGLLAPLVGTPTWAMLAAGALAGPWVQGLGRLRCLVQGCCHGAPAPPGVGIRYTHPQSRVTRLARLAGVPLHPTPLYSLLWNVVVAVALTRLWSLHAPLHLVAGLYLLLTGLGRFVEEAYRGEPQTKSWAGLRLYQWLAAGTVLLGAVVTALGRSGPAPAPTWAWSTPVLALAVATLVYFVMGVDFPASNRRFSRLA